jgi:hypothetical protein
VLQQNVQQTAQHHRRFSAWVLMTVCASYDSMMAFCSSRGRSGELKNCSLELLPRLLLQRFGFSHLAKKRAVHVAQLALFARSRAKQVI